MYCRPSHGVLISLAYDVIIIIGSCYYAFRARIVPDNFNESKFIAVNVYSTLGVGLSAAAIYTTATYVAQKIAAINVSLLVNTYISLFCLYLPKLYVIHFPDIPNNDIP